MSFITADSTPDYDSFGPDSSWGCNEWIEWHKALKAKYGLDEANQTWVKAWEIGASSLNPFADSSPVDCRTFNTEFRNYAKANGFYDGLYYGLGVLAQPIGVGKDVLDSGGNIVSNIGKGFENFSSVLKWLIPVLIAIFVIGGLIYLNKKYKIVA